MPLDMNDHPKTALIVEGGGMRGIFAAGVLHAFGCADFDPFDLYIGVSAGACHLASHLAGQNDRNFDITLRYSLAPEFINLLRFLKGGHLMDLDWMWQETIAHDRLNLRQFGEKMRSRNKEFLIVVTSMQTGRALYLRADEHSLEHDLKVSSALPILYRKTLDVGTEKAIDGGVADALPVREAQRRGATDITVIRSRPAHYVKKKNWIALAILSIYFRRYPQLVKAFKTRAENYNASVAFLRHPPTGLCVREVVPPPGWTIGRTTKDEAALRAAYETGIRQGEAFIKRWDGPLVPGGRRNGMP